MSDKNGTITVTCNGKQIEIPPKGADLSGHFPPGEALKLLKVVKARKRSRSEVLVLSTMAGLAKVKNGFESQDRRANATRKRRLPSDATLAEFEIPKKGKLINGHFRPEQAVELLTVVNGLEGKSISQVIVAAAMEGLPAVSRM